jgi:hypothetical protein
MAKIKSTASVNEDNQSLDLNIGKIVSIKTNHLKSVEQYETVFLGGEPTYITPLMVIKEVLIINSEKIDEDSGEIRNAKGNLQFKCIWFSNKSFKFEEAWFFENELDYINIDKKDLPSLKFGDNVVLKTNFLELKKRKTYLEIDKEKSNNKASALLNFCSPVFIHIGFANVEKKEPVIDPANGKPKRAYCSKMVKLKAFNVREDKYSEFLVPIEAVEKIVIPHEIIEKVSKSIQTNSNDETNKHYLIKNDKNYGVYKPLQIISISNHYNLKCENIFDQKNYDISLNENKVQEIGIPFHVSFYPDIKDVSGKFMVISILEYLLDTESSALRELFIELSEKGESTNLQQSIYKIGYKNKHEKYTNRFVIPFKLIKIEKTEKVENSDSTIEGESKSTKKKEEKIDYYLRAFCLLRNDYRYFNIDRMQYLEIHDTIELVETALESWKKSINRSRL